MKKTHLLQGPRSQIREREIVVYGIRKRGEDVILQGEGEGNRAVVVQAGS